MNFNWGSRAGAPFVLRTNLAFESQCSRAPIMVQIFSVTRATAANLIPVVSRTTVSKVATLWRFVPFTSSGPLYVRYRTDRQTRRATKVGRF